MPSESDSQAAQPTMGSTPPTSNIPNSWPGAFHVYQFSAKAVKRNLLLLIELWVVYYAFYILVHLVKLSPSAKLLLSLVTLLLGMAVAALTTTIMIAGVRGKHLTASEAFSGPLPLLTLKMLGLTLVMGVTLIVSFLALVVPFFFVYPRLLLASYFLVDKNMGPLEAFNASWRATKGQTGKIWGILGVSFLIGLLMLTIIGIPVAIYLLIMYSAAYAVLYEMISTGMVNSEGTTVPVNAPVA